LFFLISSNIFCVSSQLYSAYNVADPSDNNDQDWTRTWNVLNGNQCGTACNGFGANTVYISKYTTNGVLTWYTGSGQCTNRCGARFALADPNTNFYFYAVNAPNRAFAYALEYGLLGTHCFNGNIEAGTNEHNNLCTNSSKPLNRLRDAIQNLDTPLGPSNQWVVSTLSGPFKS